MQEAKTNRWPILLDHYTQNGLPEKIVIDGSASHYSAIDEMNIRLWLSGLFIFSLIETLSVKYLNNIALQSHRWVKQETRQALGWKSLEGAEAGLQGKEMWTMIKRGQINIEGTTAFAKFYVLAS